jgi:phage terminase large subunit-like protein
MSLSQETIKKYIDNTAETLRPLVSERIQRWLSTQTIPPEEQGAFLLYLKEMKRLSPRKKKEPPLTYEEKKINLVQAEEAWIEKARNDIEFYIWYVTDKRPALHHKKWLANMLTHRYLNIIAAPGSGKTTMITAVASFIMGKNPLWTNSLISVSDAQAQARLEDIKAMIQYNERFQNVFPTLKLDPNRPNNMNEFSVMLDDMPYAQWRTLVQTQGQPRDPTLFVAGKDGKGIIGRRWSGYCFIDDMVDQFMNADQMKKAADFVKLTLMRRLTLTGRMVNIGTRWMVDDLVERLSKNPVWKTIEFPALMTDENGNLMSYWPEVWPVERLEETKISMRDEADGSDTLFDISFMNNAAATGAMLFTAEMLSKDLPHPLPEFEKLWIITDWAMSTAQTADFTVFQAVGFDGTAYYLLEQMRLKQGIESSPDKLADFADFIVSKYRKLTDILIEDVAFQKVIGLLLRDDLPRTPVAPKGNKGFRAKLVSDLAMRGHLYINQKMDYIDILKREWINFGTAKHDDTLDPMGLLLQYHVKRTVTGKYKPVYSPFLL